ncbi:MAG: hypothetical protein GQ574_08430 [Crocinitomix sp.]|nr:hypothetical protein [Crocinitomix sp.]
MKRISITFKLKSQFMKSLRLIDHVLIFIGFILIVYIVMQLNSESKGGLSQELKSCINNPACASNDGRLIIGYTIPTEQLDPHYRGETYMVAVYESETIPEEFYDH